ncbi:penicillin-binding transpeptidase domain-containing protein [Spirosoma areae]
MRLLLLYCLLPAITSGQNDVKKPFTECNLEGSTTIYDYSQKKWLFTDEADSRKETLPASTFKIINSLIALETGVIRTENDVIKWVGKVDTVLYGYRPELYRDMTVQEAFRESAGWVYIELAKKIGRDRYRLYLNQCHYGNVNLSEAGVDFWNFGSFAISPVNQIEFLKALYEEKLPFSKRNIAIVKRLMVAETTSLYVIRAKTGWTRDGGKDTGWWVGYVERANKPYFFATRLIKNREIRNPNFADCRKKITKDILRQIKVID